MRKKLLLMAMMFGGPLYAPLNLDFTDPTVSLDPRITFSRASSACRTDPYGAIEVLGSGTARSHANGDHDPLSYSTSATSNSIGRGAKTFAVTYTFTIGDTVRATYDDTNYVVGKVTAASGASVTIDAALAVGSGTYTSWHVIRCLGLLREDQSTNGIRNNTMVGASAPSTMPTNWAMSTTNAELTASVAGVGTENGIEYIDITVSGTVTSSRDCDIRLEAINQIAAATAQSWSGAYYLREVGGSQTNISYVALQANTYTSGSVYVNSPWADNAETVTTAALRTQRRTRTATLSGATIAFICPFLKIRTAASGAVNFTLRIGLPQLEPIAIATSPIKTSGSAATRLADSASMTGTNFSAWYNQSEGTFVTNAAYGLPVSGGNQFIVRASDNTYNNSVAGNMTSTGFASIATASGGSFDGNASVAGISTANVFSKIARRYKGNNLGISKDGATVVTDPSATIPTSLTRLDIGSDHAGANACKQVWIKQLTYYRLGLDDANLQRRAA